MTDVLLCVGNSMMGDDGAGPLLAEKCAAAPKGNWVVIDGGSAPENDIVAIRELRPTRLLIVDATDMGLNPGEIRIIDPDDIHWSMTGDNQKLYRWRCRAATYANWPTLRYMLRGNTVSDAPLIIGSLDPCYSCTDRMTVVDVRKKKSKVVPYKELERYSIERKNSPLK